MMRDPQSPLRIADPDAADPDVLGEVTLVPPLAPGGTQSDAAEHGPGNRRARFPQSPLTLRMAALNALMRR